MSHTGDDLSPFTACGGGDAEAPGPIQGPASFSLAVQATSASTVALSWQGGTDTDGARYRIERRKGSDGTFATLAERRRAASPRRPPRWPATTV